MALLKEGEGFVEWSSQFVELWPFDNCSDDFKPGNQGISTLFDIFVAHTQSQPEKNCLGWREQIKGNEYSEYKWLNWGEVGNKIELIGSGIASLGIVSASDRVGIFSLNCPDWILCEYALFRQSIAVVPVYSTCGIGTIDYIIRHSSISVMFCHESLISTLLHDISASSEVTPPPIRAIILIGSGCVQSLRLSEKSIATLSALGIRLIPLSELISSGQSSKQPANPPKSSDVHSIVYTSGSEGVPKGVVITHENALAEVEVIAAYPPYEGKSLCSWTYYSYLPLAHVFERSISSLMLRCGACIGFSSGIQNLLEDMCLVKPQFIIGVPRVWKRIYDKITSTVSELSFAKRSIFNLAVSRKIASVKSGNPTSFDWNVILRSVSEKLGGRLKFVISGAAAADPKLSIWFQAVFNVKFYQGYGLSETFAAVAVQHPGNDGNPASIGPPVPRTIFRLESVPEMDYHVTDKEGPRGEILIKGPMVAKSYFNNPEATSMSFRNDGFFSTGDIGRRNQDGTITIIDRKKNLFKLAQGEYIALEFVETVYGRCKEIAQVWVSGDPLSNFLVAVVVPNFEELNHKLVGIFGKSQKAPSTPEQMCKSGVVNRFILEQMELEANESKLLSFQRAKAILLESEPWTIGANLLTPTFKLRRAVLQAKYQSSLKTLITGKMK